ncbi:MAG: murein L,D-transpeptidase catalytic domain family protein [Bacteroidota bacterium]|nr:murein L,D-transpeptidase catalytic domain family protein [Bacteroidota bacterium]
MWKAAIVHRWENTGSANGRTAIGGSGIKYVLHGLEPTNSNAQMRYVVFHSWEMVPDEEPYPDGTPEGWGCPIVSNNAMRLIDPKLKASQKPVLMWIYE